VSDPKNIKADLAREKVQRVREALKHLDEIERLLKLLLKRDPDIEELERIQAHLDRLHQDALREYGEAKLAEEER
jgi:hypothetical protein